MLEKKKILFVDDEPNILGGIRRMLHSMRDQWEMSFAKSGKQALQILAQSQYDVVVSDMRMPAMDGAEFLKEVKDHYPDIVRIVLSGHSDEKLVLKSVGPAHQYLSKPCDPELLRTTVERACALRDLLGDESLRKLVGQLQSLPSLPLIYSEITDELVSKNGTMENVGQIISKDVGMSSKVLQLVNSAFFGLRRQISDPGQAISLLGFDTIKSLVLSVQIFSKFDESKIPGFSIERLSRHVLAVGVAAKQIAISESVEKKEAEAAFMAGMLHDAGKLILAESLPEKYSEVFELVRERGISDLQAEEELFGTTHTEVGAYLLGLWGLPDTIVEAVMFHHSPSQCLGVSSFGPLAAVHVANVFCLNPTHPLSSSTSDTECSAATDVPTPELDFEFLERAGLQDRLPRWREACNETLEEAA